MCQRYSPRRDAVDATADPVHPPFDRFIGNAKSARREQPEAVEMHFVQGFGVAGLGRAQKHLSKQENPPSGA